MKYVVVKVKDNKAALLDERGGYHAIKDRGYQRGQILHLAELELKREEAAPKSSGRISGFARVAAAVLAVAVIGGGVTSYAAPVSTVTLEGASSIEYRLNMYDRVVGMSVPDDGADEEFRREISELSREVRGMKIGDAMDLTAERFEDRILENDDAGNTPEIRVTVSGLKKRNAHLNEEVGQRTDEIKNRKKNETSDSTGSGPAEGSEEASQGNDPSNGGSEVRESRIPYEPNATGKPNEADGAGEPDEAGKPNEDGKPNETGKTNEPAPDNDGAPNTDRNGRGDGTPDERKEDGMASVRERPEDNGGGGPEPGNGNEGEGSAPPDEPETREEMQRSDDMPRHDDMTPPEDDGDHGNGGRPEDHRL
ncbi:MAG: hypothetical protein IJT24_02955 [Lachnospiraceae bacterium]|nr:hypothetical protein [Lachnospiraceae bacterium]